MHDKLKWVYQITGKNLDIEKLKGSFDNLREVRNHFNHFDPPTIAFEFEEVAIWLNQVIDIANILLKIRRLLGVELSTKLINLLLQKTLFLYLRKSLKRDWIEIIITDM